MQIHHASAASDTKAAGLAWRPLSPALSTVLIDHLLLPSTASLRLPPLRL